MGLTPNVFFAGLNSGIQWDSLIDNLVNIEHRKVDIIINRRDKLVFQRTTSLEVNSRLASLSTALNKLRLESTFLSKRAISSDTSKITATANTSAAPGTYLVSVEQLARAGSAQSGLGGQIVSQTAFLGAGNTVGITHLNVGSGSERVAAGPASQFNNLVQASNITAGDTITVTGTDGNGNAVNSTFTFAGDSTDTLQRFGQFLVSAFAGTASVSFGFSGEIIVRQSSGSGTLSFDASTSISFNDADFSGSTLDFGSGVSYTDGGGMGYGSTGPLQLRGAGLHELSFTRGLPGRIISTAALSPEDTLENLGVTDFTLLIDPDGAGVRDAVNVTGLDGKTTIQGLIDIINYRLPDVTARLDSAGKLVIQSNTGGRDITAASNLGGITDVLFGGSLSLDTSAADDINSFAATANSNEYSVVDRYFDETTGAQIRKALFGTDGAAITTLIGGIAINAGPLHQFNAGVAVIKASRSHELNTNPALQSRILGAKNVSSPASTGTPPLNVTANLNAAGFATAVTAGTFTINGISFSIGSTSATTVQDLMAQVNSSTAGVVMEYDAASDRFTIRNKDFGPQTITAGDGNDTSNFLTATGLRAQSGGAFLSGRDKGTAVANVPLVNALMDVTPTTGTFTINGVAIFVDTAKDTLRDVIDKINRSAAGVTASFSESTDTFTLVQNLTENTTASRIKIGGVNDTSNFLQSMKLTTNTNIETEIGSERLDAKFTVDGVSYTRPVNNPGNVIGGLDLKFLSTTQGALTITVESDLQPAEDALVEFIAEWNKTMESLNPLPLTQDEKRRTEPLTREQMDTMSLADIDAYNQERILLLKRDYIAGDRTIGSTVSRMRSNMTGILATGGALNSLASIGIVTSGGGEAAAVVESRGRLITNSTDKDEIRTLLKLNSKLQQALNSNPQAVFEMFSAAVSSTATASGTASLNAGVNVTGTLRFTVGDGENTAEVAFNPGYYSMSQIGTQIRNQLSAGGVNTLSVTFSDAYNLVISRTLTNGSRAQITVQDLSEGTGSLFSLFGLQSGAFFGEDPQAAGGLAVRTRNYIDQTSRVGGILFERTRSGGLFDRQITDLNKAISRGEESVARYEARLRREFSAMETALTQYQAQSQWLQQHFLNQQVAAASKLGGGA